ncbi:hypothetical protein [Streptococcus uberis]
MPIVDIVKVFWYNVTKNTNWGFSGTMSTNKKRFQVSFTEEQFKELTFAALKKGLTKSSLLSVVFDEWLEDQENNQKG